MKEVNLIKISKLKQIFITLSFFAWIGSSILALVTVIVLLVGAITIIVLVIATSSITIAHAVLTSLSAAAIIVIVRLTVTFRWITILLGIVACLN